MLHHLFVLFLQKIPRFLGRVSSKLLKEIISLCYVAKTRHGKMSKLLLTAVNVFMEVTGDLRICLQRIPRPHGELRCSEPQTDVCLEPSPMSYVEACETCALWAGGTQYFCKGEYKNITHVVRTMTSISLHWSAKARQPCFV